MKFDWSKAPEWATQVIRFHNRPECYWAGNHSVKNTDSAESKVHTLLTTTIATLGEYVVLELRPKPKSPHPDGPVNSVVTASDFLRAAMQHQEDRAATYDSPEGERSMAKTVEAFNAITGHKLTEEQGWLLMGILKQVRSLQGEYKADTFEDEASYAALRGECAARTRG